MSITVFFVKSFSAAVDSRGDSHVKEGGGLVRRFEKNL